MAEQHGGESYQLDLVAMAAPDDYAPPPRRLARLCKLLKKFYFRVTAVRDTTPYPDGKPPPADGAGGAGDA
jgi:hypothetical protein